MSDPSTLRWDPRVRRGRRLVQATISPTGIVTGGVLATVGLATGIVTWPWAVAAGIGAWLTSVVVNLRNPEVLGSMLEPEFDRDLSQLDREHLPWMTSALTARDRFEESVRDMPEDSFGGMRARVTDVLHRLYDSVVWTQRADRFLTTVDEERLTMRMRSLPDSSPVAAELAEQLEEIEAVRGRRNETVSRIATTITGLETLAVKMGSLALGSETVGPSGEVQRLRDELDAYAGGLEEIEEDLRRNLPPTPA